MQQNQDSQENEILMKSPKENKDADQMSKKEIIIDDKIEEEQVQPVPPKSKITLIIFSSVCISIAVAIGIIVWQTTKNESQLSRQCYYINSTYCIRCMIDQVLLRNGSCRSSCEYNQYNDRGLCKECSQTCNSCIGQGNNCTECKQNYTAFNFTNLSVCQCSEGYYMDNRDNYNCKSCDEICSQCDGLDSCQNCTDGYYLNQTQCIKNPINVKLSIIDTTNNILKIVKCNINFFLHNNNCIKKCPVGYGNDTINQQCFKCDSCTDLSCDINQECIPSCTLGQYLDTTQNDCIQCGENCNQCTSPTICKKCIVGTFLNKQSCDLTCPIGYYGSSDGKCLQCKSPCKTCQQEATYCLSCPANIYYDPINFICIEKCENKSGYYLSNIGKLLCIPCSDQCMNCTAYPQYTCSQCANGYYVDEQQQCLQCDESCQICKKQANQCEECSNAFKYQDQNNPQKCYQVCPDRQYGDDSSSRCSSCNSSCASCQGSSDYCTSCYNKYYLNNSKCLPCDKSCNGCKGTAKDCTQCYPNFFLQENNCKKCNESCYNCSGPLDNQCTSCKDGKYLDKNQCDACDSSCKTCYSAGPQSCLSCIDGYKFAFDENSQEFICTDVCPEKYYINLNSSYFLKCSQNCYNCSDSPKYCTSCDKGKYLNNSNNKCLTCDKSCGTCNGSASNNCLSCNKYTYHSNITLTCSDQCQPGFYANFNTSQCLKCDDSCLTCNGSSDECVTCYDGQYLQNKKCLECNSSCKTCSGTQNQCLSCYSNNSSQLPYYTSDFHQCTTQCQESYYTQEYNCLKCNSSCNNCSSFNKCLSCDTSKYLNNINQCIQCNQSCQTCDQDGCLTCPTEVYFTNQTKECSEQCGEGFYANISALQCLKCDDNCLTCNGSSDECVTCDPNKYLSNQTCLDCSPLCQTCDQDGCLTCPIEAYFTNQTKKCSEQCDAGFYANNSTLLCLKCDDSCETCDGGQYDNCIKCTSGNYKDLTSSQCLKCIDNCKICSQFDQCEECDDEYQLTDQTKTCNKKN